MSDNWSPEQILISAACGKSAKAEALNVLICRGYFELADEFKSAYDARTLSNKELFDLRCMRGSIDKDIAAEVARKTEIARMNEYLNYSKLTMICGEILRIAGANPPEGFFRFGAK